MSNPVNDVLYSFSIGSTEYAENISERPSMYNWCNIADGQYNEITVQFLDQNYNPIIIRDNQVLISLIIQEE